MDKRLPAPVFDGLNAGATLIVPSPQRQAAVRAAWVQAQRDAGLTWWNTPRILTFGQFAERLLQDQWARAGLPDQLLPAGAEWACIRELRREAGGAAEARALQNSVRTLFDWRIAASPRVLGLSPESELLAEALAALERLSVEQNRKPMRAWLDELQPPSEKLVAAGVANLPAAARETLLRLGVLEKSTGSAIEAAGAAPVFVAAAQNDEHELELIASWCRSQLELDPGRRLLIVDSKLRQRRGLYDRLLSQTLTPSDWVAPVARSASTVFAIEGGRPLAEFPLIAHALLTLRLLTGRLRFDEVVRWLRMPFLDTSDVMAGAAVEAVLREGRKLEFTGEALASSLERAKGVATGALAARLRVALTTLAGPRRTPAEWSPRLLGSLRQLGWHGARALRSDEQQTVNRWHALLDEYSALGPWLTQSTASDAVATLADLARERNFDAASVEAPVTITESHDDPVVHYDGIWVAGLDAAQWPPAPRPDVFIPLRLQVAAGVPWASAAAQAAAAKASLAAWRSSTSQLICSWARLEGDAQRSPSPLLIHLRERKEYTPTSCVAPLAGALRRPEMEVIEDELGVRVDTSRPVAGGVKPLTLQAECGFRAYGEMRLRADELETPAPGLDARERGMLLHKALELVWRKLDHFTLTVTETQVLRPTIADSVAAAVVAVFHGDIPVDLRPAVDRETMRLERLIANLLDVERTRASFTVEVLEARREVGIAGGQFEFRIDRIDSIEGGGYAILDYKSGEPRAPRWNGEAVRDPQLLAYLMAERGRNVQALANVSLVNGRATFSGKSSHRGLLPGVSGLPGMNPNKVPPEQIAAAWEAETGRWLHGLQMVAADYISGHAPVQPAADVCRNCHLTTLCRRVELAHLDVSGEDA
ncbi:MAG TPA: PD-(D/E)XK nuclease family protein [Steroidobacteraceae bacterium]|nr:PD-(D/E)XK nuclease family protein [Steroidobacteraceae bacterium]